MAISCFLWSGEFPTHRIADDIAYAGELSFVHDPTGGTPAAELFRVLTLGPVAMPLPGDDRAQSDYDGGLFQRLVLGRYDLSHRRFDDGNVLLRRSAADSDTGDD